MKKLKIILLSIPIYPLYMIGEWYSDKTYHLKSEFNFIKETKEYWRDIKEELMS